MVVCTVDEPEPCQFVEDEVASFAELDKRTDPVRICWRWLKHHGTFLRYRYSAIDSLLRGIPAGKPASAGHKGIGTKDLNLNPGELVEVRSEEEIRSTLDRRNRYRGLIFMPAMWQFCGKRFRVYKKVVDIKLETTGHMRRIMSPTVFLEGVTCNRCDRECYCFWKEAWLKRVPDQA
ncbi:MAG TPA: hypothetical protein VMS81_00185 [Methanomicrobiales archaeon]|nr:hypothetical protein [Methanomicrobiales archaeon]